MIALPLNVWFSNVLIFFTLITVCVAAYSFSKKSSVGAAMLGFMSISVGIYSLGYALELVSTSLEVMLIFNGIQYIGLPFLGALWLLLALQITGNKNKIKPYIKILIFIIPVITIILRYTSQYHYLYYINPFVIDNGKYFLLGFGKGIWYYVFIIYTSFCIIYASILYLKQAKTTKGNLRIQSAIMSGAVILPLALTILSLVEASGGLDLTPIGISISTILLLIGLFKYHLLDPVHFARSKVFEWSDTAMLVLDTNLNLLDLNPMAKKIFSEYTSRSKHKKITDTIDKQGRIATAVGSEKRCTMEIENDGVLRYYQIKTSLLYDKKDKIGYIVSLIDITHQVNIMNEMSKVASTDSLTGVFVRRTFDERAEHEIKRAFRNKTPLSLLMLDIDNFKKVNDTFGHPAGDETLIKLADICRENIREIDILGRLGGDEFIILLLETSLDEAREIAERIRVKTEQSSLQFEDNIINITISLGFAGKVQISPATTLKSLYKHADIALYNAKNSGRNCIKAEDI